MVILSFLFCYFFLPLKVKFGFFFFFCVQVWIATENGNLEVTYTHNEDHVCCFINTLCILYFHLMQLLVRRIGDHQRSFACSLCLLLKVMVNEEWRMKLWWLERDFHDLHLSCWSYLMRQRFWRKSGMEKRIADFERLLVCINLLF